MYVMSITMYHYNSLMGYGCINPKFVLKEINTDMTELKLWKKKIFI